jgi:UDP-2-acetamido-2,6-beta-L-arabino-hexul-4-ose reductase
MIPGVKILEVTSHADDRGRLLKILMRKNLSTSDFGEIYITSSKKGASRANHYHKETTEWFSVFQGKGRLLLLDMISAERVEVAMDDAKIVEIPPNVAHRIVNEGDGEMWMVVYADKEYDAAQPDTFEADV